MKIKTNLHSIHSCLPSPPLSCPNKGHSKNVYALVNNSAF